MKQKCPSVMRIASLIMFFCIWITPSPVLATDCTAGVRVKNLTPYDVGITVVWGGEYGTLGTSEGMVKAKSEGALPCDAVNQLEYSLLHGHGGCEVSMIRGSFVFNGSLLAKETWDHPQGCNFNVEDMSNGVFHLLPQ
jgi:hypothetical protein